jgi:hypothetical protein
MQGDDFKVKFNELAQRYAAENVRIWQRYAEAVSKFSGGQGEVDHLQGQISDFALGEGAEFVRNLMQLSLNYYSVLLDMSVGFTNRLIDEVLQVSPEPSPPQPAPSPAPARRTRFELGFSGQRGETPSSPFIVENKKEHPVNVSFEMSEFISEDGTTKFRVPVEFNPEEFTLDPGAEQVIHCGVPMEADFEVGRRYMALVRVTGFPGMEIGLIVTPQPGEAEGEGPAEPKEKVETPTPEQPEVEAEEESTG